MTFLRDNLPELNHIRGYHSEMIATDQTPRIENNMINNW